MTLLEKSQCVQQLNKDQSVPCGSGNKITHEAVEAPENYENNQDGILAQPTIIELIEAWERHHDNHYKNNAGGRPSYLASAKAAFKKLDGFRDKLARDFNYLHLIRIQNELIEGGKAAKTINKYIGAIKHLLRFGAKEICDRTGKAYVNIESLSSYSIVEPVENGQGKVVDRDEVGPVPVENIMAVAASIGSPYREMLYILLLTAMRSGELLRMSPCEIDYYADKKRGTWIYSPRNHKTRGKKKNREIGINSEAQAILNRESPDALDNPDRPYFWHMYRKQEKGYDQKALNKTIKNKANELGLPTFNLHQVRHTALQEARNRRNVEDTAILGGNSVRMAEETYARETREKLIEIANDQSLGQEKKPERDEGNLSHLTGIQNMGIADNSNGGMMNAIALSMQTMQAMTQAVLELNAKVSS